MSPEEFQDLLESPEGSRVEFKAASGGFLFEGLVKYCVALANEGGGVVILGVTDQRPRRVVSGCGDDPGGTPTGPARIGSESGPEPLA